MNADEGFDPPGTVSQGRLSVRLPVSPSEVGLKGLHNLGLGTERDGAYYVPDAVQSDHPAPLAVVLHGAGGQGMNALKLWQRQADRTGTILLAPDSRGRTWDVLLGGYGPDIRFLGQALKQLFSRYTIDGEHLAVEGFSDGASYALSIGIANGDLFTHIIANSPGFMQPEVQVGQPRFYLSHGVSDSVLPIDHCSRRLVPTLKRAGYDVTYEEFDGGHGVPPEIEQHSFDWWLGSLRSREC